MTDDLTLKGQTCKCHAATGAEQERKRGNTKGCWENTPMPRPYQLAWLYWGSLLAPQIAHTAHTVLTMFKVGPSQAKGND